MNGVYCNGQAARLHTKLPEPIPLAGEELLQVLTVGICDTDLQLARGYMGFQGVLGHEFVGLTKEGRRVTAEINNACYNCPTCHDGRHGHCPNRTVLGILRHDGAMAERVAVPTRNLHTVPDAIDDRMAVFIEPLAAAYRVPECARVAASSRVAVLGDGKLGLLCAWVLREGGAGVSLVGKHDEKLALAGDGIATYRLDEVRTLRREFDVVVDATGSPTGLETAIGLVRPLGTVVLKTTIASCYQLNLAPIVVDEIQVVGSRCGPFLPAIEALASGRIDVRPLIQAEFPLESADEAFEVAASRGARKVILRVGD